VIASIGAWVRTLLVLALVGNLLDWVLPEGGMRRYASLVVGLVLTAAVVGPVSGLVNQVRQGASLEQWFRMSAGPPLGRVVERQRAWEVAAVMETLPHVIRAQVAEVSGVVEVSLQVGPHGDPRALRQAAVAAVEEVMSVPPERVRIRTLEQEKSGRGRAT
jgi:stage III sporulation protein AF